MAIREAHTVDAPGWQRTGLSSTSTATDRVQAGVWLALCAALVFAMAYSRDRQVRLAAHRLLAAVTLQIALGIATLLLVVPVALGAAHQAGGLLVFSAALWYLHGLAGGGASIPRTGPSGMM